MDLANQSVIDTTASFTSKSEVNKTPFLAYPPLILESNTRIYYASSSRSPKPQQTLSQSRHHQTAKQLWASPIYLVEKGTRTGDSAAITRSSAITQPTSHPLSRIKSLFSLLHWKSIFFNPGSRKSLLPGTHTPSQCQKDRHHHTLDPVRVPGNGRKPFKGT